MKTRVWNPKSKVMLGDYQGQIVVKLNGQLRDSFDEERVIDWPIMEFSGILDKNGKEIFEGDILAEEHDHDKDYWGDEETYIKNHIVRKVPGYFTHDEDAPCSLIINTYEGKNSYVEVVGNIYENPELIDPK